MQANTSNARSPSLHSSVRQSANENTNTSFQNTVCDLVDHLNIDSQSLVDQQSQSSSPTTQEIFNYQNATTEKNNVEKSNNTMSQANRDFHQNDDGDTDLHLAIRKKQLKLSQWLIDNTSESKYLDLINKQSFTALHTAVMTRQPKITRKLILAGASPEITASTGYTALHLACDNSDIDNVKAITEPLNQEEKDYLASKQKNLPTIATCLEITDKDGYTALHIAATHDSVDVVKQLISVGANLNAVENRFGRTPFHMAVENNCKKVIEFMVEEHNSCLNLLTGQGMSPYEIALNVDKQLAKDLLSLGAEPIVRDPELYRSSDESSETTSNDDDFSNESDDDLRRYDNVVFLDGVPLEP